MNKHLRCATFSPFFPRAHFRLVTAASAALLLAACAGNSGNTIGSLQNVDIEIAETRIDGSLEKALASYQKYLQETPETALTPEAIRRIADLKIKQAYRAEEGLNAGQTSRSTETRLVSEDELVAANQKAASAPASVKTAALPANMEALQAVAIAASPAGVNAANGIAGVNGVNRESREDFEARAAGEVAVANTGSDAVLPGDNADALLAANAREAIALYQKLLAQYPLYERNDQVMYQLSRAYEETGEIEEAVNILRQLVAKFPASRHVDEAYFRLGEYYFTRKKYLDAEESYGRVVDMGQVSSFYEIAIYKRGWALFKQDMYEMALDDFVRMLDVKVAAGYDFEQQDNATERKHIEDTFRVISLSFSYLGGAESIVDYFSRKGARDYESYVYSHLGEYYLDKRRYQDAALAYNAFVERNPLHKVAPAFSIRVIEIYQKGGFPRLVLEAKKTFANTYALDARYWTVFDISEYASVVEFQQANLIDLASHYHAAYQGVKPKDQEFAKKRSENYREAIHWYRRYLTSFADQPKAPGINYQLAGLMLENRDFRNAAVEYERTAYQYPGHSENKNASEAGYAAVFAYREHLKNDLGIDALAERTAVQKEIIRSSLTFAETFPEHGKAPQILLGAVGDLYTLKSFPETILNGRLLLEKFPAAETQILRSAWLLVAHASFDTALYADAEVGYRQALSLTAADAKDRADLVDNLAGAIYQQGDLARKAEDHLAAAEHFLRIRNAAPGASILATAEYDAAAALIQLQSWDRAASVLKAFRSNHPEHELQKEVTKKLAVVYQEGGQLLLAAAEFERIERETEDEDVRREALTQAAELYSAASSPERALAALNRYVKLFPQPMEPALEVRQKMADIHFHSGNQKAYFNTLDDMVRIELRGANERNERTRYLAGNAALKLAEPRYDAFAEIALMAPLERNLKTKRTRMQAATKAFSDLIDYQVADVTAAATFYLGEIYLHFSRALKESERPNSLDAMELEEYELALEEQIYPFEERAISVHEKNIDLMAAGIYNDWVAKSIGQLAGLVPARYEREEDAGNIVMTIVPVPQLPEEQLTQAQQIETKQSEKQQAKAPAESETTIIAENNTGEDQG
ncbi:tetratricopeptide repeat protein [Microbulbifer bruguierae]|uniref:Tetratricopeptide repeat protein n=1 Tax=Microbulbifer bruguierae TaxID=3029061 RepID=A0ABY8NCA7_9GAMM|nr:tetratricopeptide repeat protein [Microbulbifer bruguierae]WGL16330.1 tetratricopeptide repeat protein [Microbulbifer bruguierae]